MRTILLAVGIAAQTVCCVGSEDTESVKFLDVRESHVPNGLLQAIPKLLPDTLPVVKTEIIAWSCKSEFEQRIPHLFDDVLILVKRGRIKPKWTLLSLRRMRGTGRLATWTDNMCWTENSCQGAVTWAEHSTKKPDSAALIAFIKRTNFGANELFVHELHLLAVYLFLHQDKEFIAAMTAGISSDERSRRRNLFMRINASRAD